MGKNKSRKLAMAELMEIRRNQRSHKNQIDEEIVALGVFLIFDSLTLGLPHVVILWIFAPVVEQMG